MSRISRSRPSKHRVHAVELLETRELLASFTVTNTLDSGTGSLRQAIVNADAVSGPSTIDFSIPGPGVHDINLASVLPDITQPVTIDGTSEPGYAGSPLVEIFGGETVVPNQFTERISGLPYVMEISGDGALVEGLTFNYVVGTALEIFGSSDTVQGDVFGTSVGTFTTGDPGEDSYLDDGVDRGILIQSNASGGGSNNTIGGTAAGQGNQITSKDDSLQGIQIQSSGGEASGNVVEGNTIASSGSAIAVSDATGNTIGGTVSGAGNTLTGINGTGNVSGVFVNSGSNGTLVAGNSISGCSIGIYVQESSNVTIGGTTAVAGNVLSGGTGIALEDDSQTNLTEDELIEGNDIGTIAAGTAVGSGVSTYGIFVGDSSFDTIGGTATGAGNLISGNQTAGIDLSDLTGITSGDLIQGNRIGTDATGTNKLGNGVGIIVNGVNNTIGGTAAGSGNVISGNLGDGIFDNGTQSTIQGNFIGTDPTGTLPLGNGGDGIDQQYGFGDTIGGTAAGAGNVISANAEGLALSLGYNLIQGNFIGTDISGTKPLGNAGDGIALDNGNNTIGGTTPSSANVISANSGNGIDLSPSSSSSNLVEGNFIGTDRSGTLKLGNGQYGVSLSGSSNTIGGVVAGSGNTVEFNGQGDFVDNGSNNILFGNLPEADLNLSSTMTPSAVATGSNVIFTFTVTNNSSITAYETQVVFRLPTPSTFALTAVELAGGAAGQLPDSISPLQFSEPVGNLAPGGSFTITIIGVAYATSGIAQVDGVAVSAELDPNIANNSAQPALAISPLPADIGVVSGVPKGPAKVGQGVPYTFIVANFGPGTATDVQLAILGKHPNAASIVKVETSQGNITTISSSAYIVNVGTLLADETATVTVIVKPLKTGGNATVYAFAGWPGPDPNLSDNPTFANIPIGAAPKVPVKTNPKTTALLPKMFGD